MKKNDKKNIYRSIRDESLSTAQLGGSLDSHLDCGYYLVEINNKDRLELGLPVDKCGNEHYLKAHLFVTDSGNEDELQKNRVIGQTLVLSQCDDGKTSIYSRSYSSIGDGYKWSLWSKAQQDVQVGQVTSLDGFTSSGLYSGVYSVAGRSPETFVLTVIDNSTVAIASSKTRSISQFKYAVNADGTFSYKTRVGSGDGKIEWGSWVDLGATSTADIQDNSITAQKLSIDVREKVEKVPALEESVAREKSALVNGDTVVGLTREVYSRQGKVDVATFLKRTTAGGTSISDGVASIRQIGGNIVNNLLGGFKSVSTYLKYNVEFENDNVLISAKEQYVGDAVGSSHIGISTLNFIGGHTYYISANCYSEVDREVYICPAVNGYARTTKFAEIRAKEWAYASKVITVTGDDLTPYISIYPFGITQGNLITDGLLVFAGGINIIDLTEMFGAGKEPTSDYCDRMFATMGTMSQGFTVAQPTGLKSTGFNQWNPVNLFTGKTVADNAIVDGDKSIAFFECLPCRVGAGENNGYVIGYGEGDDWSDAGIEVYLTPIYPMTGDGLLYAHKLEKDATTGTYVPKIKGYLLVVTPVTDKLCAHFLWSGDRAKTDYEEYIESTVSLPAIPQMSEWGLVGIQTSGTLVADTIDLDRMVYTKRIGRLKGMDKLNWFKGTGGLFYSQQIIGLRDFSNTIITDAGYTQGANADGTITINDYGRLYLWDSSIESLDELKNLLKDKTLYYHLRTVETYPIVTKTAPNYVGSDYGVEEFTGSKVPLVANILFYMRSLVSETRNFLDRLMAGFGVSDATTVADRIVAAVLPSQAIEPIIE